GVEVRVRPLHDFYVSRNTDRIKCPPWGLGGGREGAVNETFLERDGKKEKLPGKFSHVLVHPGETVTFLTAGGGGYGDPAQRDPSRIKQDLKLGFVTPERASRDYRPAGSPALSRF
ncbi:MAG TPA: hydantoinase B/oxoprolinase family protein, partial [Candidatus Binatia bacterium]|nr:hydantoinase B/oxoprolinase family protein [Candidatus Binatia bacterium]